MTSAERAATYLRIMLTLAKQCFSQYTASSLGDPARMTVGEMRGHVVRASTDGPQWSQDDLAEFENVYLAWTRSVLSFHAREKVGKEESGRG
jgi:hypothetical protein